MMAAVLRFALVAALLFTLAGCSSTTFFYNRLGFLIAWNVDDYVDLSGSQKRELRRLLEPFLAWHRSQELPRYLSLLDDIESRLNAPLQIDDLELLTGKFERAWDRTESRSLEWMISFGELLPDAQMDEFLESLDERQADFEEEYLGRSEEQYREDALDNMLDPAQDYLGRLNTEQRDLLQQASHKLLRYDGVWLQERSAWQGRLDELLQRRPGWQQALTTAIDQRQQTTSKSYTDIYEHNTAVIHATLVELLNSRTEKQDRSLRRKLAGYRADILALMTR